MDIYKSLSISIVIVMLIILKQKKCVGMQLKKLPYGSDQYKTQQMCDKAIIENGGTSRSVPYRYKN